MKPINLKLLSLAKTYLPETINSDLIDTWEVHPSGAEYQSVNILVSELESIECLSEHLYRLLDDCYLGYTIPQISKEFDYLWIGDKSILNIELKSSAVEDAKIHKQLLMNQHYLRPLGKRIDSFTFTSSSKSCHKLDIDGSLVSATFDEIVRALWEIHEEDLYRGDLNNLFHPEAYLVSPFNSTEAFLERRYFLTDQQDTFKEQIINHIQSTVGKDFFGIIGGPGSGKTLLVYDIARSLMESGKKVIIGQGGGLNDGQKLLNGKGWEIIRTRDLFSVVYDIEKSTLDFSVTIRDADVYIIDEAQRSPDVKSIADFVEKNGKKCIFAIDSKQCMNSEEIERDNEATIRALTGENHVFILTARIRSNHAVYDFVNALFDKGYSVNHSLKDNIELSYCGTVNEVLSVFSLLQKRGYKICQFTPHHPAYVRNDYEDWFPSDCPSAHNVIGQEFDYVACLISPNITYESNKLVSNSEYYYMEDRMLYQIMSRARKGIHVVVFNNPDMMKRCLSIINKSPSPKS